MVAVVKGEVSVVDNDVSGTIIAKSDVVKGDEASNVVDVSVVVGSVQS